MDTKQFNLINERAELQSNFSHFLKDIELIHQGRQYNIVSIIGSQSSGKSTLLNRLFGTKFEELNSNVKRQQTTKGIWASRDIASPLIILDVEGSDSKERWEERNFYEQTTALFSLALSQLLIINIWTHEVGRFTGSQYGILKVIFEMNIKLFKQDSTKQILFILRDYSEDENFANITGLIKNDVYRIWAEISKPQNMLHLAPENLFKIDFFKLDHIKYCPNEFQEGVNVLRNRFTNPKDEGFFFKNFDYEKNLPIDGLPLLTEELWNTIKNQKDLNLPSQKVMVASLRCSQIKAESLELIREPLKNFKSSCTKVLNLRFGDEGEEIINKALSFYDENARDYTKEVCLEKRGELEQSVLSELFVIFEIQVRNIKKVVQSEFSQRLSAIESDKSIGALTQLMANVKTAKEQSERNLRTLIDKSIVKEHIWDVKPIILEILENIEADKRNCVEKLQSRFMRQKEKAYKNEIEKAVNLAFNDFHPEFWNDLNKFYNHLLTKIENDLFKVLTEGFELSEEFSRIQIDLMKEENYSNLEAEISKKIVEINFHMIKKFKFDFLRNENGVPRNWKNLGEGEIERFFIKAKEGVKAVFNLLKYFQIKKFNKTNPNGEQEYQILISENDQVKILDKFIEETEEAYKDALRKHHSKDGSGIPMWLWAVFFYFSYDDFWGWLRDGYLFVPLLTIIILFSFSYAIGYSNLPKVLLDTAYGHLKGKYGAKIARASSKIGLR